MVEIGKYNKLKAVRQTENGIYFMDREETAEVLLPNKFLPDEIEEDDYMRLFVFKDHMNRLTATTQEAKITLNHFACLRVRSVNDVGAFMDWGLDKDLLVPFKEQPGRMIEGSWYMVYLYLDEKTDRLVGSGRYQKYIETEGMDFQPGQPVQLIIDDRSDLGYNVIIGHRFRGLLYENEVFENLRRGEERTGFVKTVREDGKIDLSLQPIGYKNKIEPNAEKILSYLKENNGHLPLTDKSEPKEISDLLGMSKKSFKRAIGALYKKRLVKFQEDGVHAVQMVKDESEEE